MISYLNNILDTSIYRYKMEDFPPNLLQEFTDTPELLLKFVESGVKHPLGLKESDLIKRIKLYEPTFDYEKWISKVEKKKRYNVYISDIRSFRKIFEYLREHKIYLYINRRDTPGLLESNTQEHLMNIVNIVRHDIGFEVIFTNEGEPIVADWRKFITRMTMMSIQYPEENESTSWNGIYPSAVRRVNIEPIWALYVNALNIASILDTPTTLPEYLQYAVWRNREEARIRKYKVYPLYQILNSYEWMYYPKTHQYKEGPTLVIFNTDKDLKPISDELVALYGPGNVAFSVDHFEMKGSQIPLMEIDHFYHPYRAQFGDYS